MSNVRYTQLPQVVGLSGTEIVPVDQSDGLGGFVTRRTTAQAIANLAVLGPSAVPVTKTADFTVADTESRIIVNNSGGTTTATLPSAADFPGRVISIKTIQAQTVVSASSNVSPLNSASAGTAILAATAGKWAELVSDGSNWVIMQGN